MKKIPFFIHEFVLTAAAKQLISLHSHAHLIYIILMIIFSTVPMSTTISSQFLLQWQALHWLELHIPLL